MKIFLVFVLLVDPFNLFNFLFVCLFFFLLLLSHLCACSRSFFYFSFFQFCNLGPFFILNANENALDLSAQTSPAKRDSLERNLLISFVFY